MRLAQSYGFALVQIERVSRYDFADPGIDPAVALAEAERVSSDYELHAWEGAADASLQDDLAVLKARMATDVPSGERTVVEQVWDAARVRRMDEQILTTGRLFRAVARHRATGRIVALSELVAPRSRPDGLIDQWDTIVLPEHRGHRLGMRVKAANLIAVRDALPGARAIITWNAEENRHMLDVNEALGFRPVLAEASMEAPAPLRRRCRSATRGAASPPLERPLGRLPHRPREPHQARHGQCGRLPVQGHEDVVEPGHAGQPAGAHVLDGLGVHEHAPPQAGPDGPVEPVERRRQVRGRGDVQSGTAQREALQVVLRVVAHHGHRAEVDDVARRVPREQGGRH